MVVEITLLLLGGLGNLAWDVTGRRMAARSRRQSRLARRRDGGSVSPADDVGDGALARLEPGHGLAPAPFVEHTRVTVEELDRVVDHFDLVLLRAEAAERLSDIIYIGAEGPRERGRELLRNWIEAATNLPSDTLEQLRERGLPDVAVSEALIREHQRSYWPNADSSTELLTATANEFEAAVGLLAGFLRTLARGTGDPYR